MLSRLRQFLPDKLRQAGLAPPPLSFLRNPSERLPAGRQGLAGRFLYNHSQKPNPERATSGVRRWSGWNGLREKKVAEGDKMILLAKPKAPCFRVECCYSDIAGTLCPVFCDVGQNRPGPA